ncbi:uncharacterized protein LOC108871585 isoform X1 [Brassica rapa]|uniref:uncharacterized protein LOC108871585 isoform X1 n=1 Tax=Brassica campestris TaxID=3711 RepID=UPI0008727DE1|nr:uncharacterized protein LOC108871585 isoform X1 [Brassica rapa]
MCSRLNISTSEILYLWIQIFSCPNVLDRAALRGSGFEYCWLLSYEQEVRLELSGVPKNIGDHISQLFPSGANSLDKSLKPYQRVKIETLRCRFVFLITTKILDILLQHGYKIWKEMYGEDLDDSNVALYSEWGDLFRFFWEHSVY